MDLYFRNSGLFDWNDPTNWSLTDGGPPDGSVPTASDNVFFTINSGDCDVNTITADCASLDFTGYLGTINMLNNITTNGNITLDTGMTISGTGALVVNSTSSIKSNGKTWPTTLSFVATATVTLLDNFTTNHCTIGSVAATLNDKILNIEGDFTISTAGVPLGTTLIKLTGTGTMSNGSNSEIRNSLTIDTIGTITITGTLNYYLGTFTYVNGTVINTGITLNLKQCSLDVSGINWDTVTCGAQANAVMTLVSDLNTTNFTKLSNTGNTFNGNDCNISGNLSLPSGTGGYIDGTTVFVLVGSGTWSGSDTIYNSLTINTGGTITVSGSVSYRAGTLTYITGTVTTTSSTLNILAGCTLDTDGMSWNNVTFSGGAATYTFTSDIHILGAMTQSSGASCVFNGADMYIGGNITLNNSTAINISGTTDIIFNGTGTWSGAQRISVATFTINTAGTLTVSPLSFGVYFGNSVLTYVAGTVITTGSTLTLVGNFTLDTDGMSWNDLAITTGVTMTLSSLLSANRLSMSSSSTVTITGSAGFTIDEVTILTGATAKTVIIEAGITYTVVDYLMIVGNTSSKITLQSSTTSHAYFTLTPGAIQYSENTNATWIDSSGGDTIHTTNGTLSNTVNWDLNGDVVRYWIGAGGNFNDTANWSFTSGGVGGFSVPTSAVDVYYDVNSGDCNVNIITAACASLDFTGYLQAITMTNSITVSGNVTFSSTMTVFGTGNLTINATSTITTNTFVWPNDFRTNGTFTMTLADDFTLGGQFHTVTTNTQLTLNGNKLYFQQGITFAFRGTIGAGTTELHFVGTGTIFHDTDTADTISFCPIFINTAGTITFGTYLGIRSLTLTYISGTTITAGHRLNVNTSCTLDCNGDTTSSATTTSAVGINWNNVTFSDSISTHTLSTPLCIISNNTIARCTINGSPIYNLGGLTKTVGRNAGTSHYYLIGTGTWSGNLEIGNNLTIDTAGTITISGSIRYGTGTITHVAGTVVTTSSTVTFVGNTLTSNTTTMTWNNISIEMLLGTLTLTSNLNCSGNFTHINTTTFATSTYTINVGGSLSCGAVNGTANFVLNGTGTWSSTGTISASGYLNINTSGTITISGSHNFSGSFSIAHISGSVITTGSTLTFYDVFAKSSSITSGSITWNNLTMIGVYTFTLVDDLIVNGNLILGSFAQTVTINGSNIIANGNVTIGSAAGATCTVTGTTNLEIADDCTFLSNMSGGVLRLNLIFNSSGTVNMSGILYYGVGTITYNSGIINHINGIIFVASCSLDTDGIDWYNLSFNTTITVTLLSNLTISNLFYFANVSATITFNGFEIFVKSVTIENGMTISGTSILNIVESGTMLGNGATCNINVSLNINVATTYTLTGTFNFGGNSILTHVNGVIDVTNCSITLLTMSINTPRIRWKAITFTATNTIKFLNDVYCDTAIAGITGNPTLLGNYKLYTYNSFTSINNINIFGNVEIVLAGNTSVNTTGVDGFYIFCPITIESDGNVDISLLRLRNSTLKFVRAKSAKATFIKLIDNVKLVNVDKIDVTTVEILNSGVNSVLVADSFFKGKDKQVTVKSADTNSYNCLFTERAITNNVKLERCNVLRETYYSNNGYIENIPGLISHFTLNGTTYDRVRQHSSSNTTLHFRNGRTGLCGVFGANYIQSTADSSLNVTTALSVTFWMRANTDNQINKYFISKPKTLGANNGWDVNTGSFNNRLGFSLIGTTGVGAPLFETNANIYDGEWHHVVCTYESNEVRIYIDSVLVQTWSGLGGSIETNSNDLFIGTFSSALAYQFNGFIGDLRVYNVGLDQLQVEEIYSIFNKTFFSTNLILGSANNIGSNFHTNKNVLMGTDFFQEDDSLKRDPAFYNE